MKLLNTEMSNRNDIKRMHKKGLLYYMQGSVFLHHHHGRYAQRDIVGICF